MGGRTTVRKDTRGRYVCHVFQPDCGAHPAPGGRPNADPNVAPVGGRYRVQRTQPGRQLDSYSNIHIQVNRLVFLECI